MLISTPPSVVQVKIYDTDLEYEMANEIRELKRQRRFCERTLIFLGVVIIAMVVVVALSLKG